MSQSAQERIAAFTEAVDQARKDVSGLDLMREEIKAIESVEVSPDRSVTVTAAAQGAVRSIKITDAAMAKSAQALSQVVTRTLQLAVAKAARQQAEIVQKYAGANSKIVEKVNAVQEELLNPKTTDGFQLNRDSSADDDSVLRRGDQPSQPHPAPATAGQPTPPPYGQPQYGQPAYGQQPYGQQQYPPASYPQTGPSAAKGPAGYRPPVDDDDAPGTGVLTDGSGPRPRPQQPTPPTAPQRGGDVFQFGAEDY